MDRQRFRFAWSALLGYDIFISYRRTDGSAYAEKLWRDLKALGITPFLDRDETPGGAQLTSSLVRALRRSKMLVILLTPDVVNSEWVQQEVETFSRFRGRAIAPINIDNYIGRHNLDGTRLARLKDYSWIEETREGLETGVPSEAVLSEISKGFRKVRVRSISRFIVAAVMAALATAAVTTFIQMRRAQQETEIALANQTAAQAELIRTQDHSQLDLAAALAYDSLRRAPSFQAEQTLRAALESLPIELASFRTEAVSDIAFSRDGTGILTLSSDGQKARLHVVSGKEERDLFACTPSTVCKIAIAQGLAAIAEVLPEGGVNIRILDLMTGAERAKVTSELIPMNLVFAASGSVFAGIDAAGRACVWSLARADPPVCVNGPSGASWQLNANGKLLASHFESEEDDEDFTWQVWNTQTGAEVEKTGGALRLSPLGKYTAVSSGARLRVHNLETGASLPEFSHEETIDGVAFNANEQMIATSTSAYYLRWFALDSDQPEAPVVTVVAQTHRSLRSFTPDGLGLLTEARDPRGGTDLLVWRLRVRDRVIDLVPRERIHHRDDVYAVALHPNGTVYATLDEEGAVRIWDTRDGNLVSLSRKDQQPEDSPAAQNCSAELPWTARIRSWWSRSDRGGSTRALDSRHASATDPCGVHYAVTKSGSAGRDPELVTIYRTSTQQPVARIEHSQNVNSVVFSRDGRYLMTGGEDHLIKVWSLEQNRLVSSIEMDTEVRSARFSDDGRYILAIGGRDAYSQYPVAVYRWKSEDLLNAMAQRQMRQLTREEWSRILGARAPLVPEGVRGR